MARNIIKSIERGGYRYDVEETGDGARPYDVHQLHKAQGHWVDAGYGRYCASMAEADAYIGGQTAWHAGQGRPETNPGQTKEPHMDLIRQYLASPEFAEAIGNVVVIAIMATAAGIDWKIYGRKTRRRTPPSIDTPQRRRRAAQRRTIPAGHIDE